MRLPYSVVLLRVDFMQPCCRCTCVAQLCAVQVAVLESQNLALQSDKQSLTNKVLL